MNKQSLFSVLLLTSITTGVHSNPPLEIISQTAKTDWTQDLPGKVLFLDEATRSLEQYGNYDAVCFKSESNLIDTQDKIAFNFERNGQQYTLIVINAEKVEAFSAYFAA